MSLLTEWLRFTGWTTGIVAGRLEEYRPTWSSGNYLIIQSGLSLVNEDRHGPVLHYYDGRGENECGLWTVPDGHSSVVIRSDCKEQKSHIVALRHGWRHKLAQWLNRFSRRYVDIPLAEVTCSNGVVVSVNDRRQYSEYHMEPEALA